ncbi:hypothetical protein B0H14DRAFT_309760 [Mycena olivaceomarginata]|nr:hypothetical protein B0H14DRAFT_309760 [Mycena olivaceomarginata]
MTETRYNNGCPENALEAQLQRNIPLVPLRKHPFLHPRRLRIFLSGSPNAPVQKLPVELLGEIFSWTLGDWGVMTDDPSTLLLEPLTISHVCGQWRSISLSMPMLWATIWIDRPRTSHVPMVKLWLERSRTCPLSINLRQTDPKSCLSFPTSTEHELTDEIFALLIPHLSRWQTVDLIFKTDTQQSLLSIPGPEAVALEHVALHVDSWDTAGAESLQSTLYARPSVRSVHLLSAPACNQHHVPWAQLIHLDAIALECTPDTCLALLASCPALSSAKFTLSAQPDWAPAPFSHPEPHLTLPSLLDLSLKASRIDLAPLFSRLTLPALRTLALDYAYVPHTALDCDSDPQALHALLTRSACALDVFSLAETARTHATPDRHIGFLQTPLLRSVKELELRVDMADELIRFLTFGSEGGSDDEPGPFSNLTGLVLRDIRGDHICDDALRRMLGSRFGGLRSAELQLRVKSHCKNFGVECGLRDNLDLRFELLNCFCE